VRVTGTYVATDRSLRLSGTEAKTGRKVELAYTYYVDALQLVVGAPLREGAGTGPIGRWTSLYEETWTDATGAQTSPSAGPRTLIVAPGSQLTIVDWEGDHDAIWSATGPTSFKYQGSWQSLSGGATIEFDSVDVLEDAALASSESPPLVRR
jgi:hypothetical protein